MDINPESAECEATAPAYGCNDARLARADALKPATPDGGGNAEQDEEPRVDPPHAGHAPLHARREPRRDDQNSSVGGWPVLISRSLSSDAVDVLLSIRGSSAPRPQQRP